MTPFQQSFFATLLALVPMMLYLGYRERRSAKRGTATDTRPSILHHDYQQAIRSLEGENQYTQPHAHVKQNASHYHLVKLPGVSVKVPATPDIEIDHNHAIATPAGLTNRMRETLEKVAHP